MSTIHKTSPKIIQRLTAMNTLIISQKLSSGGKVVAAGNYQITGDIDEKKQLMNVTSSNEDHHQSNSFNIIDDKGNLILECKALQRTCLKNVFNIYSPAGFKLGSLRKRHRLCKCKTEYEICSGNQNLLLLVRIHSKPSRFRINVTNVDEQCVVATIELLTRPIDKIKFTLNYMKNIAILQKTLILCAAISCCEQEYKAHTCGICSISKTIMCCTLTISEILCVVCFVLFGLCVLGVIFIPILNLHRLL